MSNEDDVLSFYSGRNGHFIMSVQLTGSSTVDAAAAEARATKLGLQVRIAEPAEIISVEASESPQVTGPLQINSLIIHTDKVIGQGSCGTSVFEGSFEGRAVAVKRMLSQYYELASQEVS